MEKELTLREWCVERAIEMKGGVWDNESIIVSAKKIEAYILDTEPKITNPTDGTVSKYGK